MRQFIIVIGLLVALVVTPGTPASASVATTMGKIDSVQLDDFSNQAVITGWSLNRSAPSRATTVQVTVDGVALGGWRSAAVPRSDINQRYGATGGHGFVLSITLAPGEHDVCLLTRDAAASPLAVSLGCFAFHAYPVATKAQMLSLAKSIDPGSTITWNWTALPAGTAGTAQPWDRRIDIASGNSTRHLRAVMLHEWSHVLQYRAFAAPDPWWDAVQAFNSLLGHPTDRTGYDGVEHGADCIAAALGADYLGYGCPPTLKVFGARIAAGVKMNQPQGKTESVTTSARSVVVAGWALDPSHPTTAIGVAVTVDGTVAIRSVTNVGRADINAATGVSGIHGFRISVSLPTGPHRLCVLATPVDKAKPTTTVAGCTTVTLT